MNAIRQQGMKQVISIFKKIFKFLFVKKCCR
jgi:hypothetical protein